MRHLLELLACIFSLQLGISSAVFQLGIISINLETYIYINLIVLIIIKTIDMYLIQNFINYVMFFSGFFVRLQNSCKKSRNSKKSKNAISKSIQNNTSFQLNSNPRLNKFQYGILVFLKNWLHKNSRN